MPKKKKPNKSKLEETDIIKPEPSDDSDSEEGGIDLSQISKGQWISLSVLLTVILLFFVSYRESETKLVDKWYSAVKLVDSGRVSKNPSVKKKLMEEGGRQLKDLYKTFPFHARLNYFLGFYYLHSGNLDSALYYDKKAYSLDSGATINSIWHNIADDIIFALKLKSEDAVLRRNYTASRDYLKEAVRYKPSDAQSHFLLSNAYLFLNKPDSAEPHLVAVVNLDPKNVDALNNLGYIYVRKQNFDQAEICFRKVLEIYPDYEMAKRNLEAVIADKQNKGAKK